MEFLDAYSHAMAALAAYALLMIVLGAVSTAGRTPENRCDCGQPKRDYNDVVYRRSRAFLNAVEGAGPFIAALLAAVLTGASPFWVNMFASIFIVARVAMAIVHIGTTNQMARSATWAIGTICVVILAIMGLGGAIR